MVTQTSKHTPINKSDLVHRYGPWAMVTGASDGIGMEIARLLAQKGFDLLLVARSKDRLNALSVEFSTQFHVSCKTIVANLANDEGLAAVQSALESHEVGLFVAAAGFGTSGKFINNSLPIEREMLQVNCAAVLDGVHHAALQMRQRKKGAIVLFSSLVAFHGTAFSAHYAATKAWVQSLGEGLRLELKTDGIDVLVSAPGPVSTGFARRADMQMGKALTAHEVALSTVNAIGKKGFIRPGWLSKLLGWSLGMLPRSMRVVLMSKIMSGMTKN